MIDPDEKEANAAPSLPPPMAITPHAVTPANANDPYKEGTRDYYSGLCYRARPYVDGPPDKAALWEKGFDDAASRDGGKLDRSYCYPGRAALEPPVSPEPTARDCSAISAEMTLFFPDKFEDCYNKPAANPDHVMYSYMSTIKTWDRFIPSSGRYITRTLQVSYGSNTYRLIAKDHDTDGGSNGGSVCYFKSTGWFDCETNMGEHYQLKVGSIKAFLNIANGVDPDAAPLPQPAKPALAPKPKVAPVKPK